MAALTKTEQQRESERATKFEKELNVFGINHALYKSSLFAPSPFYNIDSLKWLKKNYEPTDNEIFIVTFPKTGTTLTMQICHEIMKCYYNKTKSIHDIYYADSKGKYAVSEWIEIKHNQTNDAFNKFIEKTKNSKRFWKTHNDFNNLPFKSLPKKMIIVCRNPKDALVSFYYQCIKYWRT